MESKKMYEPVAFLFDCSYFFVDLQKVPKLPEHKCTLPIDIPLHIIEEAEEEERW